MTEQAVQLAAFDAPSPESFAIARNGLVAAAVCRDRKLHLWNVPESRLVRTIDLGKRAIDAMALSADGKWIAVSDHAGATTVWNVATGAPQFEVQARSYALALAFSLDGTRLALAPAADPVRVYDVASKSKAFEVPMTTGGTQAVAFSRDGARLGTADSDTAVRIYDARNGELLARNADAFLTEPLTAAFTADGKHLLAGGGDKTIAVFEAATGKLILNSPKLADPVAYLEVSPDGAFVAAALLHADNMSMPAPVLIMETESGRTVQEWLSEQHVLGGGWTNDGHLLAATGDKTTLRIWKVR